jgi:peptidoglycan/LPS O-acetylase OafA/YrhL
MYGSIDQLTSLRFFATIYVLLIHSGSTWLSSLGQFPPYVENFGRNGYVGVSLFFILSGFILTHVYGSKLNTPGVVRGYAAAGFAQVYPVYFISLILVTPIAAETSTLAPAVPQFFLLQSWLLVNFQGFHNWNIPAWTPLLRLPEFIYGVCLGGLYERKCLCRGVDANLISMVLIASILSVLVYSKSLWVAPIVAVLFGLLIYTVASDFRGGWLSQCLSNKTMVLLGGASYSIYILQTPVRGWLRVLFPARLELVGRLFYYPVLVTFSVIVFLFFEEAIRKYLRNALSTWTYKTPLSSPASFVPVPAVDSSGVESETISNEHRAPDAGK